MSDIRTGPVKTLRDLVDHVPVSFGSDFICADASEMRSAMAQGSSCSNGSILRGWKRISRMNW